MKMFQKASAESGPPDEKAKKEVACMAKMLMPFRSGEVHPFCYQSSCVCSCQQNLDQTFRSPKFKKILFAIARVSFNS